MNSKRPASPPAWLRDVEQAAAGFLKRAQAEGSFEELAAIIRRRKVRGAAIPASRVTVTSAAYLRTPEGDSLMWRGMLAFLGVTSDGRMDFVGGFSVHPLTGLCPTCAGTGADGHRGIADSVAPDFLGFSREVKAAIGRTPLDGVFQEFYSFIGKSASSYKPTSLVPYRIEVRAERLDEAFAPVSDAAFVFGPRKPGASIRLPPPLMSGGGPGAACLRCGGCGFLFERELLRSR